MCNNQAAVWSSKTGDRGGGMGLDFFPEDVFWVMETTGMHTNNFQKMIHTLCLMVPHNLGKCTGSTASRGASREAASSVVRMQLVTCAPCLAHDR